MHYTSFKPFLFKSFLAIVIFPFMPGMALDSEIRNTDRNSTLIAVGGGGHGGGHGGGGRHGGGHRGRGHGGHHRGIHGGGHHRGGHVGHHHRNHPRNERTTRYDYPYYSNDGPYYDYREDRARSDGS